uniref:phage tail assembly protein T n=1 Tax=Streptomyces odonnellii TaxID=1417980 RepID=UPI000A60C50D|nr:hypothetical protein [Streptomyces odonnellii]
MAYENVTGLIGGERLDGLVAMLAATVANTARSKGTKAQPKDFLPKWDRGAPADWQQMLATVRAMNSRFGGTDHTIGGDRASTDAG